MPRLAATVCSILCCVSLAWAMGSQRHAPWRAYQREYLRVLRAQGGPPYSKPPGVLEVRTEAFGVERSDRCTTCHVAVSDRRFEGHAQPLSYHPAVAGHPDMAEMACTLCHQGNGRMLTEDSAHGIDPPAAEPLLQLRYVQAACLRCHDRDTDLIAPKVAAGRRRFLQDNCFGCHAVKDMSSGSVGPELTDIARRRTADYLRAIMTDPAMTNAHSPMPPIATDRETDLDELVTFLLTLRGARQAYVYQP